MPSWLPSIAYPPAREEDGFWAPVTSTIDWCEENYYATRYSAEIVNSLTNLLFVYLAFKGMHNCLRHGHDNIFFLTFFGYLIVGSGSLAFHSTLKYPMQLVDELSMIYTTCLMFWATFEHKRPMGFKVALAFGVAGLAIFITLYYHYLQDPSFHQNAYAILTVIVLFRSMYIMEREIRPLFRGRHLEHQRLQQDKSVTADTRAAERLKDERDVEILRRMWILIVIGLTLFLGGVVVWTLDNVYCSKIRSWRHEVGLPWGLLLEGHGWWHLMTGLGAYFYIVWGIWLRHCLNHKADEYELLWPSVLTSLPRIERTRVEQRVQEGLKKRD
ncbi:hypothetical protein AC579_7938 [Pseudocercospora musae]|uniref:Alkaline ceramidase n=1 Tax=Pseudocercospora musae TaxID=113226 RepID=A0A139IKF4_9PEZI|nr:hypothetical protein AC579_7938 [Pseudocercospora musae]KXT15170.1 hypothetical protein AC579_7938 [Pseudocercospora musae]KXT15171.1 hypothetical protein AC579_7938 [Pseudocercospora musae]